MIDNCRSRKWLVVSMLFWVTGFSFSFSSSIVTIEETIHHVFQGQTLFVYLPEDHSMEQQWEVEISNSGILSLLQKETLVRSSETDLADPLMTLWEFKALHPGFVQILFRLKDSKSSSEYPSDFRVFFLRIRDHTGTTSPYELVESSHLEVTVGTQIQIKLEEDASMGYMWDFSDLSSTLIRFDKKTEEAIKKEGVFREMRLTIWEFSTIQAGLGIIHFQYLRTWECPPYPLEERFIVIRIRD